MIIALNFVLACAAAILFTGVIGEKDTQKNTNVTIAFVAVIMLIIAFNTIM